MNSKQIVCCCAVALACLSLYWMVGKVSRGNELESTDILRSPATDMARRYRFSEDDHELLEEIQHGCFQYLWNEVGSPVPLVKDRMTNETVSSLAGVGFQLSALPIGIERGWITHEQGERRAETILRTLIERNDNKKFGIYLHYVDLNTGGMHHDKGLQVQASTVDHALLQAGAIPAAVYFGGEVAELVVQMIEQANWKIYQTKPEGFISFGWRPEGTAHDLSGAGEFRPWNWHDAGDEERIVYFLAVGSPNEDYSVPPEVYYRLDRVVKQHEEMSPFAVTWGSQPFTFTFSHCWIDYHRFGADNPADFGEDAPRIDWFENSRRAFLTHRQRCIEASEQFKTLSPDRWGLNPAADLDERGEMGYIVPAIRPNIEDKDNFCHGTVAPYAAGSAIMFMPELAVAALREFRNLKDDQGNLIVWRDPASGGYGLLDSFNLDRAVSPGTPDYLSIDDGPMLVAIENARTGLIWKLFMQHPLAQRAVARLRLSP